MDKEYMLFKVRERMKELKRRYAIYVQGLGLDGKELIPATAALKRCETKRNLQILMLVEHLLITSQAVFIDDDDAIEGFDKLVNPRVLK